MNCRDGIYPKSGKGMEKYKHAPRNSLMSSYLGFFIKYKIVHLLYGVETRASKF